MIDKKEKPFSGPTGQDYDPVKRQQEYQAKEKKETARRAKAAKKATMKEAAKRKPTRVLVLLPVIIIVVIGMHFYLAPGDFWQRLIVLSCGFVVIIGWFYWIMLLYVGLKKG